MSGQTSVLQRMLAEHRRVVLALLAVLVVNVVVYAFAVYPLAQRVANVQERDRAAEQTLAEARRDHDLASGTLTGKDRASTELATFYRDVLPANEAGARRLVYLRPTLLAGQSGLKFERSSFETDAVRGSSLTHAKASMVLRGTYDAMRTFTYQLETAPEFVVIDDIGLAEGGSDTGGDLVLTVQLSTYFHSAGQ